MSGHPRPPAGQTYPHARRLVAAELERARVDHYDDSPRADCPGCRRTARLRLELEALERIAREARHA